MKKKSPKIVLLKYCQPTGFKVRSPRLEMFYNSLKGSLKKKGGKKYTIKSRSAK
jgi:hypothetical protein